MAELLGVELARLGEWQLASGPMTVTADMLADAARYAQRDGARPAPVKIGHTDPRFTGDGEPALGWVGNVRVEEVDGEPVLRGDITDMPDWLAAAAPKAWPYRSIEGWQDLEDGGEVYRLAIDGLALLGVTPPGMSTIRSLRDLPQALGVAASARIVASVGDPRTSASAEDSATSTPPTREGAVGMPDAAKLREALGLKADASDQEVTAAFAASGLAGKAGDQPPTPSTPPTPPNPSSPAPQPEPQPEPEKVNAAGASAAIPGAVPGTVVISASVWEETQETIKTLKAFVDKTKRDERDQVIASAVQAGKLRPADKPTFVALWDEAPDKTRDLIDRMTPNSALAVMASGYAGQVEEDDLDAEYAGLFPPSGKGR